jgi:hypothetical protein
MAVGWETTLPMPPSTQTREDPATIMTARMRHSEFLVLM